VSSLKAENLNDSRFINVLHVDDDRGFMGLLKEFIEKTEPSIVVDIVESPYEAIDILEGKSYDCVLSDYVMPGLDGLELLNHVKNKYSIPFIVYTGKGDEDVEYQALEAGADDYIRKQPNIEHYKVLTKRIKMIVNRYRALKERNMDKTREGLQKYRTYNKHLKILHQKASELHSAKTLKDVACLTFDIIDNVLGKNLGLFGVIEGDTIRYVYVEGRELPGSSQVHSDEAGVVGKVAKTGASQIISDTSQSPGSIPYFIKGVYDPLSSVTVPIEDKDEVLAVIHVEDMQRNAFSDYDKDVLEFLANHIASAIGHLKQRIILQENTRELMDSERIATASSVAAMVSHDLRGPLHRIEIGIGLLNEDPDKKDYYLKKIESAVHECVTMLEEVELRTSEPPLDIKDVDLENLVKDAIQEVSLPSFTRCKICLKDLKSVSLDRIKIRRVFYNLIKNAVEAMPEGGEVIVNGSMEDNGLKIEVSDTGVGISEKIKPYIFRPFQSTKTKGMGLGLAYCKKVITAHGGNISFRSEPGTGTTFTITLPQI
jgi:signal transduction histidine kinase/DNA-binding response OmpR family regulator